MNKALATGLLVLAIGCGGSPKKAAAPGNTSVPPAVTATIDKEAAGAKVESVENETEDGAAVYEAMWHVDGHKVEITVKPDGTLVEREDEVKPEDVPEAARTAATTVLAGAATIAWVKLNTGNFEAEGVVDGKERDVVVDPTGKVVKSETDESAEAAKGEDRD